MSVIQNNISYIIFIHYVSYFNLFSRFQEIQGIGDRLPWEMAWPLVDNGEIGRSQSRREAQSSRLSRMVTAREERRRVFLVDFPSV
jgi:hypothetical protein